MRVLLKPITYLVGAAVLVLLLLSIASALLRVCDWIEEDPDRARRRGRIGSAVCIVLLLASLPSTKQPLALLCTLSGLGQLFLQSKRWPSMPALYLGIAAMFTIGAHLTLIRAVHGSSTTQARPRLAGGRLDWDIPEREAARHGQEAITPAEAAALTALLWLPCLWNATAACARSWGLPSRHESKKR